jgi:hypothetical protein
MQVIVNQSRLNPIELSCRWGTSGPIAIIDFGGFRGLFERFAMKKNKMSPLQVGKRSIDPKSANLNRVAMRREKERTQEKAASVYTYLAFNAGSGRVYYHYADRR